MKAIVDMLRDHSVLASMTDWQRECLTACAQRSMFHAGNRIFHEQDPADRMWLIVEGRVVVDSPVPKRGHVVIDTLGPGDVLGWSWMFAPYRWHFGAVALETTMTVELDGPQLRQLFQRDPALGLHFTERLIQVVAGRLQATRRRLIDEYSTDPDPPGSGSVG